MKHLGVKKRSIKCMKTDINKEIISSANCSNNFKCLNTGNFDTDICSVSECLYNQLCVLNKVTVGECSDRFYFGSSEICKCPVRIEIFNKYGI